MLDGDVVVAVGAMEDAVAVIDVDHTRNEMKGCDVGAKHEA